MGGSECFGTFMQSIFFFLRKLIREQTYPVSTTTETYITFIFRMSTYFLKDSMPNCKGYVGHIYNVYIYLVINSINSFKLHPESAEDSLDVNFNLHH